MKKLFTFAIALFAVLSINAAELLNDTPATNYMMGWGTGFAKEVTTVDGIQCYHISTTTKANPWDVQFAYDLANAFEVDAKYNLKIKVKASAAYNMGVGLQNPSNYSSCGNFPSLALTTDWQELTASVVCNAADGKRMVFSIGDFVGDIYVAYVILEKDEAAPVEKTEVLVFQDTPANNQLGGWGTGFAREITNVDGKDCYKLSNSTSGNSWDVQFAYDFAEPFEVGQDYRIKMVVKASDAYNIPCQFQNPSSYSSCGDFPALKATKDWQELVVNGSCTGADGKRLVFSMGNFVGDIYVAQVSIFKLVDGPAPFVVEGDKYVAILEDKTIMEPIASIVGEGGVATNAVDGQSTIMVQSDNVLMTAVSAANPKDVPCEETSEFAGWTAGYNDAKWEAKNQGDIKFSYIQGSGNPAVVIGYEKKYSENQGTYSFVPAWTYYMSDGSNGLPKKGLYYKFAVAKDGVLKVDVWANKGNRRTFVVDDETMKALPYEAEGYINGKNEEVWDPATGDSVNVKKWLSNAEIQALHDAAGKTDPEDAYIIGAGNQPFWGTISFPVQAGKTYWVFQHSSQIGFRGFELVEGGASAVLKGDANGDGQINVNDISTIAAYILEDSPQPFVFANADVNGDDVVNVNDISATVTIILDGEDGDDDSQAYLKCPDNNHPHAIDLGLPSGTKWCCCNVGATTPEGYGGYYAWGETSEKSYYSGDTYAYYNYYNRNIGSDIAGSQYDVAHVRMGGSWRMPSHDQQMELMNNCTREWTQQNGVNGTLVIGKNGGQIFLPAAGYRRDDGLSDAGSDGYYWSSSLDPREDFFAANLYFSSGDWRWYNYSRIYGLSVRAVCP